MFRYPPQRIEGDFREMLLAGGLTDADLAKRALAESSDGSGPRLFFHHADGPKVGRNRLHLGNARAEDAHVTARIIEQPG